jgi:iron complex outermembrane receptor protein
VKLSLSALAFLPLAAASFGAAAPVPAGTNDAPFALDPFTVTGTQTSEKLITPLLTLPRNASISTARIADTVNLVDTEDAVKYLPSLFLRKRNNGDTQAVMATRTWGVSSSARSLIYADGVPLTALIANNNNIGGPRWGLVAPAEIESIDVMYGPFSAAYAGNSMGAVMEITTRLPEKRETTLEQTVSWQDFRLYGTRSTYAMRQTAATYGDRQGPLSFWISANTQDSHSQPLTYVTAATFPAGTTGAFAETNKTGAAANVLGASGLLHTRMTNGKIKVAYQLTPTLRAAYSLGLWSNAADSTVDTYLRDAAGQPTFAGQSGFASGYYRLIQQHSAHSLTLASTTHGNWDFEAAATLYRMDRDNQRLPTTASTTGTSFGTAGRVAVLGGTGWSTLDLKGVWRPGGQRGAHLITFGVHDDRYKLYNPTFNTTDWLTGGPYTTVATEGDGKTRTQAVWAQDHWQAAANVKLTFGARYEEWRASDGLNVNGATTVIQPAVEKSGFSPKATLAWALTPQWTATASVGQAYRFATAAELYQLVSTGATFTSPNADLKPDDVVAAEFRIERTLGRGKVRLAFFQDDVHDAIISQFKPLVAGSNTLFSFLSNVDHVRARGVEFSAEQREVLLPGLELSGSATYLDARTLALSGQASATAAPGNAIGRRLPNIPAWRATLVATYKPNTRWTFTAAGRYSGMLYTTLDNADTHPNTYQGFAPWFVADVKAGLRLNARWSASIGADNVLNRKYFLFHPFPQRTVVVNAKLSF